MPVLPIGPTNLPAILYPSTPPVPNPPTSTAVAGGPGLLAGYDFFAVTYEVANGIGQQESQSSIVSSALAVSASQVGQVTAPAYQSAANGVTGWNVYGKRQASSTPPALSSMARQAGPLPLITITAGVATPYLWTEPNTGLLSSAPFAPSAWDYFTLQFQRYPRKVPAGIVKPMRNVQRSYAGFLQVFEQFVENTLRFDMEWISLGSDAASWLAFLQWACSGAAFDYYPNGLQLSGGVPLGPFTSYWWLEDTAKEVAYKAPGQYQIGAVEFTQAIY